MTTMNNHNEDATDMMEKKMDRTVLVTGGAGFIGSHLIDRLLLDEIPVVCVDNLNNFYSPTIKQLNQSAHLENELYTFKKGDIRNRSFLERVFDEYDIGIVVHLAAMAGVRPSLEDPMLYTDVNINGTQTLLEVMVHHAVDKFLFASSSSVYGNNEKVPFSEDDNVDYQVSPYGATKKMGEILCYNYHHLHGIPTSALRFFTVYGPRQRPEMAIHKFVRRIFNEEPIPFFGDGNTARDYTYIDDIVDGIVKAMQAEDEYMVYNLGNSEPVKLSELVDILGELTGKNPVINRQELPPGDVLQTFADIERAKKRLDYHPQIHIMEGLQKFIDWYRQMKDRRPRLY